MNLEEKNIQPLKCERKRSTLKLLVGGILIGLGITATSLGVAVVRKYIESRNSEFKVVDNESYKKINNLEELANNLEIYEGELVEISNLNLVIANYTDNQKNFSISYSLYIPDEEKTRFLNELMLLIEDKNPDRDLPKLIQCIYESDKSTTDYQEVAKILNRGDYKGSIIIRGLVKNAGADTLCIEGHRITLDYRGTKTKDFVLSDLYLK